MQCNYRMLKGLIRRSETYKQGKTIMEDIREQKNLDGRSRVCCNIVSIFKTLAYY